MVTRISSGTDSAVHARTAAPLHVTLAHHGRNEQVRQHVGLVLDDDSAAEREVFGDQFGHQNPAGRRFDPEPAMRRQIAIVRRPDHRVAVALLIPDDPRVRENAEAAVENRGPAFGAGEPEIVLTLRLQDEQRE